MTDLRSSPRRSVAVCGEWLADAATGHEHMCEGPEEHPGALHTCRCGHQFLIPLNNDEGPTHWCVGDAVGLTLKIVAAVGLIAVLLGSLIGAMWP